MSVLKKADEQERIVDVPELVDLNKPQPGASEKYARVGLGTQNNDVLKLKDLLTQNGYSGFEVNNTKFGNPATNALKEFQKASGLGETGVADDATWEALMKKFNQTTASGNAYNSYTGTGNTADLAALEGAQPGAYNSSYGSQISGLLNQVLNREKFSYNMNADPLYQQYKDQYVAGGRNAMMDTMGNAAALTGGFGNSYASTAGNQAYQGHLQGLNDKALDLYGLAYGQYRDEGNDMRSNLGALTDQDNIAYGRYRDEYGNWQNERDYTYGKTQADQDQANWQKEYELALQQTKKKSSSGGGGGGGSGSGSGGSGGSSGSSGSGVSGTSNSDLLKIAQNIYHSAGMVDPYSKVDQTKLSAAEKAKVRSYLDGMLKSR